MLNIARVASIAVYVYTMFLNVTAIPSPSAGALIANAVAIVVMSFLCFMLD